MYNQQIHSSKSAMKAIEAFAAQFPAVNTSDDAVEKLSNELFAYSGLFERIYELQLEAKVPASIPRYQYEESYVERENERMKELITHLDTLLSMESVVSNERPDYGKEPLARDSQAGFLRSICHISNAAVVLQQLESAVHEVRGLIKDRSEDAEELAVVRAKAELRWEAIEAEAVRLEI